MKNNDYGYYSKTLKQPFDSLDELRAAEEKAAKIEKAKDEKKEDAKIVNDAYTKYIEVSKKANEEIAKARKFYEDMKAEFIKKYGAFHMTYTSPDGKESREISEVYSNNFFDTITDFAKLVDKYLRG